MHATQEVRTRNNCGMEPPVTTFRTSTAATSTAATAACMVRSLHVEYVWVMSSQINKLVSKRSEYSAELVEYNSKQVAHLWTPWVSPAAGINFTGGEVFHGGENTAGTPVVQLTQQRSAAHGRQHCCTARPVGHCPTSTHCRQTNERIISINIVMLCCPSVCLC